MMRRSLLMVAVLALVAMPVWAGAPGGSGSMGSNQAGGSSMGGSTLGGFQVNPNDQVVMTLLAMVINDLEMCRASLHANYVDNVLAIGHLNNAQSALKRSDLDTAYAPLVAEILDRIGKIKFYLVMRDRDNVFMRLNQLVGVLRSLTGQGTGTVLPGYGGNYYPGGGNYYPGNGQYVPGSGMSGQGGIPTPRPTERPIGNQMPVGGAGVPMNRGARSAPLEPHHPDLATVRVGVMCR